jgi:hypothetical protein
MRQAYEPPLPGSSQFPLTVPVGLVEPSQRNATSILASPTERPRMDRLSRKVGRTGSSKLTLRRTAPSLYCSLCVAMQTARLSGPRAVYFTMSSMAISRS